MMWPRRQENILDATPDDLGVAGKFVLIGEYLCRLDRHDKDAPVRIHLRTKDVSSLDTTVGNLKNIILSCSPALLKNLRETVVLEIEALKAQPASVETLSSEPPKWVNRLL